MGVKTFENVLFGIIDLQKYNFHHSKLNHLQENRKRNLLFCVASAKKMNLAVVRDDVIS